MDRVYDVFDLCSGEVFASFGDIFSAQSYIDNFDLHYSCSIRRLY